MKLLLILRSLLAPVSCLLVLILNHGEKTKICNQLEETTAIIDGYTSYFSFPHHISGYSGVATYCRNSCRPIHAEEGLLGSCNTDSFSQSFFKDHFHQSELQQLESEGRVLITEHSVRCEKEEKLAVINVYCPRADPDRPERKEYKLKFYQILAYRTKEYIKKNYHVVIVGDINTTHKPIDHCCPGNVKEFLEDPARKWLDSFLCKTISLLENGGEKSGIMIDTFRYFNPDQKDAYTCWNSKTNARMTNYGTRIDYILANQALLPFVSNSIILPEVQGSDHCPVASLLCCTPLPAKLSPKFCTRNWSEFAGKQQTLLGFLQNNCSELKDELQYSKQCFSAPLLSYKQQGRKTQKAITHFLANNKRQKCFEGVERIANEQNLIDNENISCILNHVSSQQCVQVESKLVSSSENIHSVQLQNTNDEYLHSHPEKTSKFCSEDQIYKQMFDTKKKTSSVEQRQVWKNILSGPPPPPLCKGHKEPCVLRTVKKEGPNNGRQFFACCKPNGHPSNPNASCNHFEWVKPSKPTLHKS